MDLYGIIGYPLGHSFSPDYYNRYFQDNGITATYERFELKNIEELPKLLRAQPQLKGFNVTIPYKERILPLLDQQSEEAIAIGAVNCVKIENEANRLKMIGHNTDAFGFRSALLDFMPISCTKALILGNGGAAKAVRFVLDSLHISSLTVTRKPKAENEISYTESKRYIPDFPLIINTTPSGTWPEIESLPNIEYNLLSPDHYLFDLVYNPAYTSFMKQGNLRGAHCCNGHQMLLKQAEKNLEIWKIKNNLLSSQTDF